MIVAIALLRNAFIEFQRLLLLRSHLFWLHCMLEAVRERPDHPSQVLIADVLNFYLTGAKDEAGAAIERSDEAKSRILKLSEFFGADALDKINGEKCRAYVTWRTKQFRKSRRPDVTGNPPLRVTAATARRELEELRAAINFHRREGYCSEIIAVALRRPVWCRNSKPSVIRLTSGSYHLADMSRSLRSIGLPRNWHPTVPPRCCISATSIRPACICFWRLPRTSKPLRMSLAAAMSARTGRAA